MSVNKSKIDTAYDKNFMPTPVKRIPKKQQVYIKTNTPSNGSPRTVYHKKALNNHVSTELKSRRAPRSPLTRIPLNDPFYTKLYTLEELKAAKSTKSNKYKLIEHMKTRKKLTSEQKLRYLNLLKSGRSLGDLIRNVNRITEPKTSIIPKSHNNITNIHVAHDLVIQSIMNTEYRLFMPKNNQKYNENIFNNVNMSMVKKVRALIIKHIYEELGAYKDNKTGRYDNYGLTELTLAWIMKLRQLELAILAVSYMESESDFKDIKGIEFVKPGLYEEIKRHLFEIDGIKKIQIYITRSFYIQIFKRAVTTSYADERAKQLVEFMTKDGIYGFEDIKLEDWLIKDYEDYIDKIVNSLNNYNINKSITNTRNKKNSTVSDKTKEILKHVVNKYHPNNKKVLINKINAVGIRNFKNITKIIPKSRK